MKSVQIRSYFWYAFSCIWTEYRKMRTRNNSVFGHFSRGVTTPCGTETISYLAPKIWSLVPNAMKSSKSVDVFKSKIRQWEPNCPCRLCKNYLQNVGFIYFSGHYFFKSTPNIMYLIRFEPMLLSCFCVFCFIAPYVDISGINS